VVVWLLLAEPEAELIDDGDVVDEAVAELEPLTSLEGDIELVNEAVEVAVLLAPALGDDEDVPLTELVPDALDGPEGVDEPLAESDGAGVPLEVAVLELVTEDDEDRLEEGGAVSVEEAVYEDDSEALLVGELVTMDEGLIELDAELVPEEDAVSKALSVLVPVPVGVTVGAVEPELDGEADDVWPLVDETDADALVLGEPLAVAAADNELLGLVEAVPVPESKLELLPEADCE
jgi:hypothetical protein